jgi:hypothetical protein
MRHLRARLRARRAARQGWDPDIIQGLLVPVPAQAQQRARDLIKAKNWQDAIDEIRCASGRDRRDARCATLALMYGWRLPQPARRSR